MPPLSPAVGALLAANLLAELLKLALPPALLLPLALWPLGGPSGLGMVAGEPVAPGFAPWQLLTYGFLHASAPHLAFNMLGLWMFGTALERLWGSGPLLRYYLGCVLGAGLAQLAVTSLAAESHPTVGASGGIFGLLLGFALMFPRARILLLFPPVPLPARLAVLLFGGLELALGVFGSRSGIAHFAHLGGLACGWLIIQYWRGRLPLRPRRILLR
ncbi:MAG: rhomboid family intramembrane serine protease [Xanthomonadales bacterium]|nr:rhomboid family intramembrane serine protease [Xanthomonadales bacterium]